jgi:outer membrane protein W
MKLLLPLLVLTMCLPAGSTAGQRPGGPTPVRRFVLVAGANRGAEDRALLRYALSDGERFVSVLQTLGGVDPGDVVLLRQPKAGDLDRAFTDLEAKVRAAKRAAGNSPIRTEVFFYYSGHGDERGMLLGNDRLSYTTLRASMEGIPADVRIGVLDACASGAITRPKGGKLRSPFTVDPASDMRGSAFLASSSADEAAQESERLGGSFFTHYLISGMRGAADLSGDGRVTLNEAYQFALTETLGRTVGTRGGPQHPVYDITMSGTGDVVLTDLRQLDAGFTVGAAVEGRFYVLDDKRRLVLEFHKAQGRRVQVGLEAGVYDVRFEREKTARRARVEVRAGMRPELDPATFGPASVEFTRLRGYDGSPADLMRGRFLAAFRLGMWSNPNDQTIQGPGTSTPVAFHASVGSLSGGIELMRFVRDDLAVGVAVHPMLASVDASTSAAGSESNNRVGVGLPLIARYYPLRRFTRRHGLEPYVGAGVGPLFGADVRTVTDTQSPADVGVESTIAGLVQAGADLRIGRFVVMGASASYNWSGRVANRNGSHTRYGGAELSVGIGVMLGKASLR